MLVFGNQEQNWVLFYGYHTNDLCFILNYFNKQEFKIGIFFAPFGKANLLKCFKTLQTANYASEMVDWRMLTLVP